MASSAHVASSVVVKPATLGLSILVDPDDSTADVVFVHGFNGHPERTWLHKGDACNLPEASIAGDSDERPRKIQKMVESFKLSVGRKPVHWPRDLLPSTLPRARILTYGYDTHLGHRFGPAKSQKTVYDFAKDFLLELEALRRSRPTRPLLFIAHSLGGIVVKEMLRQSYGYVYHQPHLRAVSDSTKGVIFFGTPHGGADPRSMLKSIAENIARAVGFTVNEQVLDSLLPSSERLRQLRDEFGPMARAQKWIIHCFQEDHGIKALGGRKVVEDVSSCLADATLEVAQHIADNHMNMCRFSELHDVEYRKVAAAVSRALAGDLDNAPRNKQTALSDAERQAYVKSLRFDQIDVWHATIKSAHAKTCKWLLKQSEYEDWLARGRSDDHNGFLWIKGKAGSGKSTMLKYLLSHARRTMTGSTIISFFFNARGHDLERSTTGMYRSLLLQLFDRIPELQCALDTLPRPSFSAAGDFEGEWSLETLKTLFRDAVRRIRGGSLICFVDALDECDEDDVRDMLACFENLCQEALPSEARLQICFSSRHYPHITVEKCVELVLEGQEGHQQDMANYLQSELKIGKSQHSEKIKDEVLERANSVFLWLVLVVQILQKEFDRGRIHALQRRLTEIPPGLDELFRDILTRDGRNLDDLVLCLQWVLFAKRPLRREELYFGILAGTETDQLTPWDPTETTTHIMERFILDCSKGLAELTKAKLPTVQFIHESVRDYLLRGNGLSHISTELTANFSGMSHERLKLCCHNYLKLNIPDLISPDQQEGIRCEETVDCPAEADNEAAVGLEGGDANCATEVDCEALVDPATETGEVEIGTEGSSARRAPSDSKGSARDNLRATLTVRYPFLEYAINYVYDHAEGASRSGITQDNFFAQFDLRAWIARNTAIQQSKVQRYSPSVSLLYIFAEKGLPTLVRHELTRQPHMEIKGERHIYPLRAAILRKDEDVIREFFSPAADRSESTDEPHFQSSAVHLPEQHFDPVSFVLQHREVILPLKEESIMVWALGRGKIDLVSALLATEKIPLRWLMRIPGERKLEVTLAQEHSDIRISVKLLLYTRRHEYCSQLNLLEGYNGQLIITRNLGLVVKWARKRGYQLLVRHILWQCILESMNCEPSLPTPPLLVTPLLCDEDLTAIISENAGSTLSSLYGRISALFEVALELGVPGVARHMLQHSNVSLSQLSPHVLRDTLGGYARSGDCGTTQFLLAEVFRCSLQERLLAGKQLPSRHPELANILLHRGIDPQNIFFDKLSFVDWQMRHWDEARVWLSLQQDPEIGARDRHGRTSLALAAIHGRAAIVRVLMNRDADINSQDSLRKTPLIHACGAQSAEKVTKLILPHPEVQIDDISQNSHHQTVETAERGDIATVRVLLQSKEIDANVQDADGCTALWWAVLNKKIEVVELLLERPGIDLSTRRIEGSGKVLSPAELAAKLGYWKIEEILRTHRIADHCLTQGPDTDIESEPVRVPEGNRDIDVRRSENGGSTRDLKSEAVL
ncbi:hypothetical protein H2200_002300 [Cladophialophora chaetospira]|uniref:NACHT domain-containing protein n=1 Tax=Cladophialophora chaetospira TaxID=386627 RepID=A0AA38XIQ5_9EURO|nr:hypothetical protein H2200_002300 [Cladophialophora chaetospira]